MTIDLRLDILNNLIKVGEAFAESVSINYDYSGQVMKSIRFDLKKTVMSEGYKDGFDLFKNRIRPVLIRDGNEYPLGIYMIMAAPVTRSDVEEYISIEGYDETMILKQAAFEERKYYAAGTSYLAIIESILTSYGFANVLTDSSDVALPKDLEAAVGKSVLEFINDLLDAMNYQHIYTDFQGNFCLRKAQNPLSPDFTYSDKGKNFSLLDYVEGTSDIYNLPNVVVGVYSSTDSEATVTYKKVNDNINSAISTVNRGYKVVKKVTLKNSATSEDLQAYVERIAFEAMQATERVRFTTVAEGNHEPNTAVQLDTKSVSGLFIEKSWRIDASQGKVIMSHTAERKVFV